MMYKLTLALSVFTLVLAGPASAAMVVYEDFDGTSIDTSKWDVVGSWTVTGSEAKATYAGGAQYIYGKTYPFVMPQNIGEKLTFEVKWRKHENAWFTQPSVSVNAVNLVSGTPNEGTRTYMGAILGNATGYYRSKDADGNGWYDTPMGAPTYQYYGNVDDAVADMDYDTFQFIFEVVDAGGGVAQHNFSLMGKGHPADPTTWMELDSLENYSTRRDVADIRINTVDHAVAVDYIAYEFIPEPATMGLLGFGGLMTLLRRKR